MKLKGDGKRISMVWTIVNFINKNNYKECEDKSDEFKSGFICAIELLREELIKLSN